APLSSCAYVHHLLIPWASPLFLPHYLFNTPATSQIYTLSLHDALPISASSGCRRQSRSRGRGRPRRSRTGRTANGRCRWPSAPRSEEHTSELQSLRHLVCRLLLEKKKKNARLTQDGQRNINCSIGLVHC